MPNSELNNLIADVREQVLYLRELGVEALDVQLVESGESRVESQSANPISNLRSEISNSGVIKPPVLQKTQPPQSLHMGLQVFHRLRRFLKAPLLGTVAGLPQHWHVLCARTRGGSRFG